MRRRTVMVAGGLALLLALAAVAVFAASRTGEQPIRFNHKAHVSKGLDCTICHRYVREQSFASLPTLEICLMCHATQISQNPEEGKIREFAGKKEPLRWVRLYRLSPDASVYFSHRRHVTQGKVDCVTCHGPMPERTSPPPKALVTFSMDFCLDCHRQKQVATTCVNCHR